MQAKQNLLALWAGGENKKDKTRFSKPVAVLYSSLTESRYLALNVHFLSPPYHLL